MVFYVWVDANDVGIIMDNRMNQLTLAFSYTLPNGYNKLLLIWLT